MTPKVFITGFAALAFVLGILSTGTNPIDTRIASSTWQATRVDNEPVGASLESIATRGRWQIAAAETATAERVGAPLSGFIVIATVNAPQAYALLQKLSAGGKREAETVTVSTGSRVEGDWTVTAIEDGKVTLSNGAEIKVLELFSEG